MRGYESLLSIDGVVGAGIARNESNNYIIGITIYVEDIANIQEMPSKIGEFKVFIKKISQATEFEKERMLIHKQITSLTPSSTPFFPTQKEPATSHMSALLEDELIVDENGCIRAKGGEGYLFSLDLGYKQYLKEGKIDERLRKALERIYMSSSAKISKINEKKWKVDDKVYPCIIEETDKNLNIYSESKYLIIWPYGFSLKANKEGAIHVIDDAGQPVVHVGDKIGFSGGECAGCTGEDYSVKNPLAFSMIFYYL
ncbi:hypothetical protein MSIBF_A2830004 [groundwater metagenome]|uniref:Uncharacterized protein n=1 Tax=groundwater metagenome TaxID=717931 RepID=A0A098ECW9_9ZZZZ